MLFYDVIVIIFYYKCEQSKFRTYQEAFEAYFDLLKREVFHEVLRLGFVDFRSRHKGMSIVLIRQKVLVENVVILTVDIVI